MDHARAPGVGADRRGGDIGLGRPAFKPLKQRRVGRRQAMPDFFDIIDALISDTGIGDTGERRFRQSRGDADTQTTGQQFQQRPSARGIQLVEPGFEPVAELALVDQLQFGDDVCFDVSSVLVSRRLAACTSRNNASSLASPLSSSSSSATAFLRTSLLSTLLFASRRFRLSVVGRTARSPISSLSSSESNATTAFVKRRAPTLDCVFD